MKQTSSRSPWGHTRLGDYSETCDAQDRITQIQQSSDVSWLRAVLAWPENQLNVRLAAERRLRRLARKT